MGVEKPKFVQNPQFLLGIGIPIVSILAVSVLSWFVLDRSRNTVDELETAKYVFSTVLPLFATWVGTVLAYYFSKENFESANTQVRELVKQITPAERLAKIRAADVMISLSEMDKIILDASVTLDSLMVVKNIRSFLVGKNRERLPIISLNGLPQLMLHKSRIDSFIVDNKVSETEDKSLKQLLETDAVLKNLFETSFVTVKGSDSLAEAKSRMERRSHCEDVFVTEDGTKDTKVVGWLTNKIIAEKSVA